MDTNVEASVVINKLTQRVAQLTYDMAVLEAVNEQLQAKLEPKDEPAHVITDLE